MAGSWKLRVTDSASGGTGMLFCWGLDVTYSTGYECCSGPAPFTTSDVTKALSVWAGLSPGSPCDLTRLNVDPGSPGLDILDAARIARKVAGLEANP